MQIRKLTCALLILAVLGSTASARAKVVEDVSGTLKTLSSIGDALDSPDHHPVHILYVHGIDDIGAGDSSLLRDSICTKLKLCNIADWKNAGTEFPDKGEFAPGSQPPALNYFGSPIWNNAEEWRSAAPFVVHWVVHLRRHPAVLVVDEINWWPLALSLKCRHIVETEVNLAGPAQNLLKVCSQQAQQDPGALGRFYPWISPDDAAKLAAVRPHAVLVNRELKQGLIDWGLSDVVLVVGPLEGILRDALRQLLAKSAAFDPNGDGGSSTGGDAREKYDWREQLRRGNSMDQEFVGVTHSLGGYLLFDALTPEPVAAGDRGVSTPEAARHSDENNAMQYIFGRMSLFYFLANQLQMLEMTNLSAASIALAGANQTPAVAATPEATASPTANFMAMVHRWQRLQTSFQAAVHPGDQAAREQIQIVAWSDPSDVLTWRVPNIGDVDVVNLYVQNAKHLLWIFESPTSAHGGYAGNKDVLEVMFQNRSHTSSH